MKKEQACRRIDNLDYYLQHHTDDYSERDHEAMMMAKKALEQKPSIDELRAEITALQNRCYALTMGVTCGFCNFECQYKVDRSVEE